MPPGEAVRREDERTYAGELLRKLKEHGWLEDYRDPIDLKPTLKLSRAGKAFSETFASLDDSRAKTRQRNMRSARKALAAFLASLRDVFVQAQAWPPGYAVLARLTQGDGHPPALAAKTL